MHWVGKQNRAELRDQVRLQLGIPSEIEFHVIDADGDKLMLSSDIPDGMHLTLAVEWGLGQPMWERSHTAELCEQV